jgi:hypothetical protein
MKSENNYFRICNAYLKLVELCGIAQKTDKTIKTMALVEMVVETKIIIFFIFSLDVRMIIHLASRDHPPAC